MTLFRLKHVGLAVLLMASLLTASPAACTCSHPEESAAPEAECHSHHDTEHGTEASGTATLAGETCICVVDQRTPCVSSKSEAKDLKSKAPLYYGEQVFSYREPSAAKLIEPSAPLVANPISYSSTLRSLLPSRAPPRL